LVAPFIADYVLGAAPARTRLLLCLDCSFRFFAGRYSPEEVQRLYSGYRGPAYFAARHRREFWYSQRINDAIGGDAGEIASRNAETLGALADAAPPGGFHSVLDYGGDRGQFIPPGLGRERFVYEISGPEPVPGVSLLAAPEALRGRRFDLILLANVLEHSSDPGSLLRELRSLACEPAATFLFSVPLENFSLALVPARGGLRRAYESYLDAIAASPLLASCMDFYSTAFRLKLKCVPPFGFIKMHEHINFFNEASLRALLARAGYTVSACGAVGPENISSYGSYLLCTATAKPWANG
jgi:hypothetical protein